MILLCSIPKAGINTPSLALGYLSGACKEQGIDVALRDFNLDLWEQTIHGKWWEMWKESDTTLYKGLNFTKFVKEYYGEVLDGWAKEIADHEAEWVGISCFSYRSLPTLKLLVPLIRALAPNKKIIVGGAPIPTYAEWIKKNNLADYIIVGEGDIILPRIINENLSPGIMHVEQIDDLDALPIPDYDGIDFTKYTPGDPGGLYMRDKPVIKPIEAGIMGSRGCVRKCTFCDVEHYWPKFRWRSAANIYSEMMRLYNTGVREIYFYDSLMNGNQNEFEALLDIIIADGSRFNSIKGLAIFKQQPKRLYAKMEKACIKQLSIGVESFSEPMRTSMRKMFSNEIMEENIANYQECNIELVLLMVIGYPSEMEHHHKENLKWINDHAHMSKSNPIRRIEIGGTMLILPGAPVFKNTMFDFYTDENNDWVVKNEDEYNTHDVRTRRREETEDVCRRNGFMTGSVYGSGGVMIGDHERGSVDYMRPQDKLIPLRIETLNFESDDVGWESDPTRASHQNL